MLPIYYQKINNSAQCKIKVKFLPLIYLFVNFKFTLEIINKIFKFNKKRHCDNLSHFI